MRSRLLVAGRSVSDSGGGLEYIKHCRLLRARYDVDQWPCELQWRYNSGEQSFPRKLSTRDLCTVHRRGRLHTTYVPSIVLTTKSINDQSQVCGRSGDRDAAMSMRIRFPYRGGVLNPLCRSSGQNTNDSEPASENRARAGYEALDTRRR
jgi:hypothetical protein